MGKKSNHVIPSPETGWAVKKAGSSRLSQSFEKKEDAVRYARDLSKKEQTELYIHKRDGTIQEHNSYGKTALPSRG